MSIYITAQLVGFLGYLLLSAAPYFRNKDDTIKMDILACVFLSVQWFMLNQSSLLVLNILNIALSLSTLKVSQNKILEKYIFLFYPLSLLMILMFASGTIVDVFCIIAFFALVTAKKAQDKNTFRSFSMLSSLAFAFAGALAFSLPALIFNMLRFTMHSYRFIELYNLPQLCLAYAKVQSKS